MTAEFDHWFSKPFMIPKVKGLASLNDLWPISLLGWVHRLVARVLTLRLRLTINKLVSHTQTTFIRGRSIYDGWVIASEVLNVMKKEKNDLIFKTDLEKAYGCVS